MSQKQAEVFAATYAVVDQFTDPVSGLSATLFDRDGVKYLAVRGTETDGPGAIMDLIADVGVFEGLNGRQQYQQLESYYRSLVDAGKIQAGNVYVTGHSLGGLLAQMLAVDYAGEITHTTTFNAPGLGGVAAQLLDLLGIVKSNVPLAAITNLRGEGLSPIATFGTLLGEVREIFIEQRLDPVHNHSIVPLTDALGVYRLFAALDPALSLGTITELLRASSPRAADTLERALSAVGALFGKEVPRAEVDRDSLYRQLYELTEALPAAGPYTVVSLVGRSAAGMLALARADTAEGLALRYALKALNSFALVGADYTAHNADGALERYDPATGAGSLTDAYLADRAAFLSWKLLASRKDSAGVSSNEVGDWHYRDLASGEEVCVAGRIDPAGAQLHYALFGADQGEALTGAGASDRLYGGGGNDTLEGAGGRDCLEGNGAADFLVVTRVAQEQATRDRRIPQRAAA